MLSQPPRPPGYIYFVEAHGLGLIKIGHAKHDVINRIRELTTGCPVRLELRSIALGARKDERNLHRHFRLLRQKGEWFRDHPTLRAMMARHALPETIYFSSYGIEPPWYKEIVEGA